MEKTSTLTTWECAQQLLDKNIELAKKRQESIQARIPSDPNTWHLRRENYEAIILEDHAFSEKHKIEFSLWHLHYKRIEEFRIHLSAAQASAQSAATINSRTLLQPGSLTKIRAQFKAFLSEATGFYHDLILKIRAKYSLPVGHFSDDADNLGIVGVDTIKSFDVKKALGSCYRCLIYLGDLARYKGLYGEAESRAREYSAASSYYFQAASLLPSNGNPHHQLAILATYSGDEVVAVYRYFRSLAAEVPIPAAKNNLINAFEKNRHSYTQLLETRKTTGNKEVTVEKKYKDFSIRFVRLHGILFSRTSLETFSDVLSSVTEVLHELLSSGPEEKQNFGRDSTENGLAILRLSAVLIFTVIIVSNKNEGQSYAEILQYNVLYENACTVTFELMGLIVQRCLELRDPSSSFLLPGILVFLEWLACFPNVAGCSINEKKLTAVKGSFWKHCITLLNKLVSSHMVSVDDDGDETCFMNMSKYEEGDTDSRLALWEDFELRGFSPLLPVQNILEFSRNHSLGIGGNDKERRTRVKRIISAGKALASVAKVNQKTVSFDSNAKQFVIGTQPQVPENRLQENHTPSVNSLMMSENFQLAYEGEDEDEEIVFKPVVVENQMDSVGLKMNSVEVLEQGKTFSPLTSVPFNHVISEPGISSLQVHPATNSHNSTWLTEQQASILDGIKKLRFVDNGLVSDSYVRENLGFQNAVSPFPPQSSASTSLMDTHMYSGYTRDRERSISFPEAVAENILVKPPTISESSKSQGGRPIRHLGPPPGFSHVPPKSVNMPVPNVVRSNGSMNVDDYRWLDGFQPSLTSSLGASFASNQESLSNRGSSNGHIGFAFSGMQLSGVQSQGGNMNGYSEYQSFGNTHPNNGQKLLEQQGIMAANQFGYQGESYPWRPTWTDNYRV